MVASLQKCIWTLFCHFREQFSPSLENSFQQGSDSGLSLLFLLQKYLSRTLFLLPQPWALPGRGFLPTWLQCDRPMGGSPHFPEGQLPPAGRARRKIGPEGPHRGRRETEGMVSVEQQDPGRVTQVPELACNVGAGGCLQTGCAPCKGLQTPGWLPFSGAEGHCCVRKPQPSPSGGAVCKRGLGLTGLCGAPP